MNSTSINTFQLKLSEDLNRKIKSTAAENGLTKHDWIMKAILKQLEDQDKAV